MVGLLGKVGSLVDLSRQREEEEVATIERERERERERGCPVEWMWGTW